VPILAGLIVFAEPMPGGAAGVLRGLGFAGAVAGGTLLAATGRAGGPAPQAGPAHLPVAEPARPAVRPAGLAAEPGLPGAEPSRLVAEPARPAAGSVRPAAEPARAGPAAG